MDAVNAVMPQVIFFSGRSWPNAAPHRAMTEIIKAKAQNRKRNCIIPKTFENTVACCLVTFCLMPVAYLPS